MTASIVALDEKCEKQLQDIATLQEEKTRLLLENEAVGILQAQVSWSFRILKRILGSIFLFFTHLGNLQVEVYRSDFIAERDCRERLAGEKEQLAEDLRRLHRHNQELRQTIE